MVTRKKAKKPPEPVQKKFIFVSQALYLNQYVVYAKSMEEAHAAWCDVKDSEEEGDVLCVQQLMQEEVIEVKEAH